MKRLALLATAAAFGIWVFWAPNQGREHVYQKSPAEAHRILAATGLPPEVFGSEDPEFSVDGGDPSEVTWTIRSNGVAVLRLAALMAPDGDAATRVRVTIEAATEASPADVAKRLEANPTVKNLYRAAMEERVASALEDRDFSLASVYPQMMIAVLANLGRLRASVDTVARKSEQRDRDNIQKAYEEEAAGRRN